MPYKNGTYYNVAYTYAEAKEYLAMYKAALTALVDGQAKEYTIGSRSVTLLDLEDIERMIAKFAKIVNDYELNTRPTRNAAIVFRDT